MRRAARKRTTRQLEQVFKALEGDHTHPFAHEICTLLLDEQGARFDPETSQHDHFVCERCGRVVDLFLRQTRPVDLSSLAKQGYVVTTHSLTVHGLCQICAARRRTSRSQRPARKA